MTYRSRQLLADIQAAIDAVRSHLLRGDLSDGLVFDAVRIRLQRIGHAPRPAGIAEEEARPVGAHAHVMLAPS